MRSLLDVPYFNEGEVKRELSNNYHTTLKEIMGAVKLYNSRFEDNYVRDVENSLSLIFKRLEKVFGN